MVKQKPSLLSGQPEIATNAELLQVSILRNEIKNHYVSGTKLYAFLGAACFAMCGAYAYVTPLLIESKTSTVTSKLDKILELLSERQSHSSHSLPEIK